MILYLFIGLYLAVALLKIVLDSCNLSHIKKRGGSVPAVFADIIKSSDLDRANEYSRAKTRFGDIEFIFHKCLVLIFILSGLFAWYSNLCSGRGLVFSGLLFFGGIFFISFMLEIPFGYYGKFNVEQKYEFNTSTIKTWIIDQLRGLLVGVIIGGILLLGLLLLLEYIPGFWWIIAWILAFLFSLFLVFIYPLVIAPLFNKFTPVEGSLKSKLVAMAAKAGVRVTGVFKMDESRRSRHTNAYFSGIGKSKRIVLFDTLIEQHPEDEIVAILAHELGHWKRGHVLKLFLISQVGSFLALLLASWAIRQPGLYTSFGISAGRVYAGLFILMILFEIPSFFLAPLTNRISRHFERESDAFAVQLIQNKDDLASSLKRLVKDNLSALHPHPLYVSFFYSHPPVLERLKAIQSSSSIF